jgi:anti-sigma-K factor RskA
MMHSNQQNHNERETTMSCQEMEELLGAYALEALSDEEREAADAHLAGCPKCRHTLQQLQAIVDLFPLSVPAIDPPPRVKEQILARIQREEAARQFPASKAPAPVRRRFSVARVRTALLAACALVLLLLLTASFLWNISLSQQIAQLSTRVAPPVISQLHGSGNAAAATGQVIYYPQQNITVLRLYDLPDLKGTQVYQGWLLQGQRPTSIGLLNVQHGVATLDFQGNLNGFDAVAVSQEPGPAASQNAPKGPVVALGAVTTRGQNR